jgi:thiopeptide-type bacteriocin biosynthesis protein
MSESGQRQFGGGRKALRRALAARLRDNARALHAMVEDDWGGESGVRAALDRRSTRVQPIARELAALARGSRLTHAVAAMVPSYAHMFVNRLLRAGAPAQETAIYDFLGQLYRSRRARAVRHTPRAARSGEGSLS